MNGLVSQGGFGGLTILVFSLAASADLPTIRVHEDGHYFQKSNGEPFFWAADTAWNLWRLDPDEVDDYLADRAAKGFTVIQGPVLYSGDDNYAGRDNNDIDNPDELWFQHIDYIVERAAHHGLYIAPAVAHGAAGDTFSNGDAFDFGDYVGDRYRDHTNVITFLVGTEYNWPDENVNMWTSMALGMLNGLDGEDKLLTMHPRWYGGYQGQTSSYDFHEEEWLGFNMLQSGQYGDCVNDDEHNRYLGVHNWLLIENDWNMNPPKPVFDGEPTYEQINPPDQPDCEINQPRWQSFPVRRRAYWSVFAGGAGVSYGANGVFQFNQDDWEINDWAPIDTWDDAIHYPGAAQMGYLKNLILSRPFYSRIPGQDILLSWADSDVPDHVHATRDAYGRWAMIYIPEEERTVRVDLDLINSDMVRAWWFFPSTGEHELIDTFNDNSNGEFEIQTPDSGEDWVLVIDDPSENYPPPGVLDDVEPEPDPGDFDGDGDVDNDDLLQLLGSWGTCNGCDEDLDGDGQVDIQDLLTLLQLFQV